MENDEFNSSIFEIYEEQDEENTQSAISVEELLISLVQLRPALWDSRLPLQQRNKSVRDKLWVEIYTEFGKQEQFSVEFLIKKWRNLRDTYVRLKSEYEAYIPSGSDSKKKKKRWEFYDAMSFLKETVEYRPTTANLSPKQNSVGDGESLQSSPVTTPEPGRMKKKRVHSSTSGADAAIINVLKTINAPPPTQSDNINPICRRISDMLSVMPQKERRMLEITLMQTVYEAAKDYM